MFDLIIGKTRRLPSHATLLIVISTMAQGVAALVAVMGSAPFIAQQIPRMPTMVAFVAPAPSPPTPPAPPRSAVQRSAQLKPVARAEPVRSIRDDSAPVDESRSTEHGQTGPPSVDDGVRGGVEGGVPSGIVGGFVESAPEPPPPPVEAPPVRIGGTILSPTLVHRVEPVYPPAAAVARLQGLVILEAIIDRDGTVSDVKVLRTAGSILDREALTAVRQWRYAPLVVNGRSLRFVVTVMLTFSVANAT